MTKYHTNFWIDEGTKDALQSLATALGLMAKAGPRAGDTGSSGQLLDAIAGAVKTHGVDAVADVLRPLVDDDATPEQQDRLARALAQAKQRMDNEPRLQPYREILFAEWSDLLHHLWWIQQAPTEKIVSWAESKLKVVEKEGDDQ